MGSRLDKNSSAVRKRIEQHTFTDEGGEEYSASSFGGFTDYMRRKKIKLQNLDAEIRAQSSEPQIFRGVVVHVNGYTQPSLNDLHKLVVSHGGGFLQYLSDGKTTATHIVASNLTPKKREEFKRYRVVKPAWIVDSVTAGKLLPWDRYRLIDDGERQKVLGFHGGQMVSQRNTQDQRRYREQTDHSWYTGQVKQRANELEQHGSTMAATQHTGVEFEPPRLQVTPGGRDAGPNVDSDPDHIEEGEFVGSRLPETEKRSDEEDSGVGTPSSAKRQHLLPAEHDDLNSHAARPSVPTTHSDGKPLTAEEHNAILLADPKVWKSTVVNPGFLKQYYEESRLHHLSTWKAELKSQLQALAQAQSSSQKARSKRPKGARRYILHVDFDSFFVAVSLLKHPEYKELPACVAHGGGSGSEIASCNYPARKYGVKNGMWMKTAQELCPNMKVLPYDFKAYEDASRQFYEAIMEVGGIVQSVSVDEALIDISNICIEAGGHDGRGNSEGSLFREQKKADELASQIGDEVKAKTQCAVSVGIGGNILQAKLALRKAKPAGQFQLKPEDVLDFVGSLKVQDLPGVAYSIGNKLEEIGIKLVKDIRETSRDKLISTLGPKTGEKLWEYSRGIDRVEVGEQVVRKSVSAEVNWGIRFATQDQADEFIRSICEELEKRLLNEAVKGRQFSLKIMRRAQDAPLDPPKHLGHGKCDVFNKSVTLGVATNDKAILSNEALSILRGYGFSPGELRGIGVQMTKLEPLKGLGRSMESSQKLLSFQKATNSIKTTPQTGTKPTPPTFAEKDASNSQDAVDPVRRQLFKISDGDSAFAPQDSLPRPTRVPVLHGEDEIDSPRKSRVQTSSTIGGATPNASLLNTSGTQFILPSQIDPNVLAEIPNDIRAKFRRISQKNSIAYERSASPTDGSDADSEPSQLDPDTLAALPEELRGEILAQYRSTGSPSRNKLDMTDGSPRTVRMLKAGGKKSAMLPRTAASRSRGHGSRGVIDSGLPTLTQANFVTIKHSTDNEVDEEVSDEFLAALPEQLRDEITGQQQRNSLRRRGGLDVEQKKLPAVEKGPTNIAEITARQPFTSERTYSLAQLRRAIHQWYDECKGEEPASEDVEGLEKYLSKVVLKEHDMAKAVAVVRWIGWVVGEGGDRSRQQWKTALGRVKQHVRAAVSEKGLGRVEF